MKITYTDERNSKDGRTPRPRDWNTQFKIEVFEYRFENWTLDMADLLKGDHRSNYARLSIVISYFEMIGLYLAGATSDLIRTIHRIDPTRSISYTKIHAGTSTDMFKKGIEAVADTVGWNKDDLDEASTNLYSALRCGLYHGGLARHGIWVGQNPIGKPFRIDKPDVIVDPNQLIEEVRKHFSQYVDDLKRMSVAVKGTH